MKPMDAPCVCHENVTFSARFRTESLVPPYADAIASFWKGRLASGPRASARPSLSHLLGNASVPFDINRTKAQADLMAIQKRFGTTIVFVTHDMEEAIHLGDRIAVMDGGKVIQYAPPEEILSRPANMFVDRLIGTGDRPLSLIHI